MPMFRGNVRCGPLNLTLAAHPWDNHKCPIVRFLEVAAPGLSCPHRALAFGLLGRVEEWPRLRRLGSSPFNASSPHRLASSAPFHRSHNSSLPIGTALSSAGTTFVTVPFPIRSTGCAPKAGCSTEHSSTLAATKLPQSTSESGREPYPIVVTRSAA